MGLRGEALSPNTHTWGLLASRRGPIPGERGFGPPLGLGALDLGFPGLPMSPLDVWESPEE